MATSAPVEGKRRPLRSLLDGLTPAEYAAYSVMYSKGAPGPDESRLYRGGYADLCTATGLSKRGVQNIVAHLQQKLVIGIHQAPGYHRSQVTTYRALSETDVLGAWAREGYTEAAGRARTLIKAPQ